MPRSAGVRARYPAIARALLRRLAWDSRTSFGAPVEPDVLRSSARSGCNWRDGSARRPLDAQAVVVDADDGVGLPRRGEPGDVGAGEQRHVATVQQGQVRRHELDGVRCLEDHQRAWWQVELAHALIDGRRQPGVGHDVVAGDERRCLGRAGAEQDRGDPLGGHPRSAPTQYKACLPSDASRASRCGLQPERPLAWRLDDHSDPPPDDLHPRGARRGGARRQLRRRRRRDAHRLLRAPLRHRDGVRDVVGGVRRRGRLPHRQ